MATTKRELIARVALKTEQKQRIAKNIIQTFMDEMIEELAQGNRLEFREFGVFDTFHKEPRIARNPHTGDMVKVPAKAVVRFKVGRLMKQRVRLAVKREKTIRQSKCKGTIASLPVSLPA